MRKLRLQRGEFAQTQGPVTSKRYTFMRGQATEVDDVDADAMLRLRTGCCGLSYPMFREDTGVPHVYGQD